ncbi:histidine triad (HIT) protein [Desulfatibacillum aliphaticivorans]|uniref:Histidine triad (HIT) protein n=1 Tax=Desulfatibacillum aliphaticivorans TaxID=218208 RepID=B8FGA0_DESAL|nr:histidine triad nucleotide-binding protein [Desulfatibacillum aliphaticivorans]ACL03780.1 histidine triad (HIT) protein [Desulfatibacillum aliphaticivorans]
MEQDCIFCKIVAKESPADIVYENDKLVVFKDINPEAPVHLLVVPKKHIRSVNDIEPEDQTLVGEMVAAAKLVAAQEGINESGYNLLFNVERGGGQIIFHLHLHLLGGWKR